jgi:alkylation response protein AidB-like acyl-CoA dehydrogenase
MENDLATARLAHYDRLSAAEAAEPGEQSTNRVMTARAILALSAIRSAAKATDLAGGAAFYQDLGLKRHIRDVQAARFHPLQEKAQLRYAVRIALGLNVNGWACNQLLLIGQQLARSGRACSRKARPLCPGSSDVSLFRY